MGERVAIVMGSVSDKDTAAKAEAVLKDFGVEFETHVISAHRTPNRARSFAASLETRGIGVVIAVAGLAAHLPGVLASLTLTPVIGVPAAAGPLAGNDALLSIVQMPPGVPVACVGIGNAKNAAVLAVQILSVKTPGLRERLEEYRAQFGDDAD